MAGQPPTALPPPRVARLRASLETLCAAAPTGARLAMDPLSRVRRYGKPQDQEIAAVFASALAFGRVTLFLPVLDALLALADAAGGPQAWIARFSAADAAALAPLAYRWNRPPDLALLALVLQAATDGRRLGSHFEARFRPEHADLGPALDGAIGMLRDLAVRRAGAVGLHARTFEDLPRSFRTLLPRPSDGSACKRWNMLLRWMVRRPGPHGPEGRPLRADGVDLGLWALPADRLIVPLDTHILRLAGFLGLTSRGDGSWRTAAEITRNLARLDPADPLRYDFALAHLGISADCRGEADPGVCPSCPLVPVCRVGGPLARPDQPE